MVESDLGSLIQSTPSAHTAPERRSRPVRPPPDPDDIKTLRHGIAALRLGALRPEISSGDLAVACRISRAAAYRVLQTLHDTGYMLRAGCGNGVRYVLTPRSRELTGGYDAGIRVLDAAIPLMLEWTEFHGWPLALATPAGDRAVLRFVTDLIATRVLVRIRAGAPSTALTSAVGLVCLAYQPPELRDLFVRELVRSTAPESQSGAQCAELAGRLERVRHDGYAVFGPAGAREASIAMPVWIDGSMCASIAMRYMQVADGGAAGRTRRVALLQDLRERIVTAASDPRSNPPTEWSQTR